MIMARFNLIAVASYAMHAGCFCASATSRASSEEEHDLSIATRGIVDVLDTSSTDLTDHLPSRRRLQQPVSDACLSGRKALFEDDEFSAAFFAYRGAEEVAFEFGCNVPRDDGVTLDYVCDVQIDPPTTVTNFEGACVAAGGMIQDFGGAFVDLECCGEGRDSGNFLTYGYRTLDQRACLPTECTADEARIWYFSGMFMAAKQVFEEELGLVCGGGAGCGCGCIGGCDQCPPMPPTPTPNEPDAVSGLCHGYITGPDYYFAQFPPESIPCGGHFGDSFFPSFQDLSCCSADGRHVVKTGQIGGFDAGYTYDVTEPKCYNFVEALSMVLCDPRQGDFIDDTTNVLRICRSSCDMVFDICGLPGANFPEWTEYTDGTSLCYEMFGGFGDPAMRSSGYVYQSGLTIEVIAEDQNCIDIVVPTQFDEYGLGQSPDACAVDDDEFCIGCVVGIVVGVIVGCLLLCYLSFLCLRKVQGKEAGTTTGGGDAMFVETPAVATEIPSVTDNGNDSVPMIHAVAFLEPLAGEPASTNIDLVAASAPASIPTLASTNYDKSNPPAGNPSFAPSVTAVPPPTRVVPLVHVVETTDSHDQVRAVKNWMQANPTDAAALTPEDTAEVLSKVTFSLNQASVAKELAVGIGGNKAGTLTCAHVAAAMKECSLQKKDVAECMVPHVNDPCNKDAVLNGMEFLSERDSVAKCFRR
jgi:hypothetical protein